VTIVIVIVHFETLVMDSVSLISELHQNATIVLFCKRNMYYRRK